MIVLNGCTNTTTTSISIEENLPKKIDKQLNELQFKENTGFKLFSNNKDTYYLIYDTSNEVDGFPGIWETEENSVIFKMKNGNKLNKPTRYIYKIKRNQLYDSIEIEKNGLPSSFDLIGNY